MYIHYADMYILERSCLMNFFKNLFKPRSQSKCSEGINVSVVTNDQALALGKSLKEQCNAIIILEKVASKTQSPCSVIIQFVNSNKDNEPIKVSRTQDGVQVIL